MIVNKLKIGDLVELYEMQYMIIASFVVGEDLSHQVYNISNHYTYSYTPNYDFDIKLND
jgi:hypothetical protein